MDSGDDCQDGTEVASPARDGRARASPCPLIPHRPANRGSRPGWSPAGAGGGRGCKCKEQTIFLQLMTTPIGRPAPRPEAVLATALLAAAERLGLRGRELAAIIGTSEATVSRLRFAKRLDPASKEGELALLFLRAYRSLDALVGGDDAKARLWLRAENVHLDGIPADRVRTVEGLVDVVQYLDALRGRL